MFRGFEVLGVRMDPDKKDFKSEQRDITANGSRVKVLVIPTNEELMIAREILWLTGSN